MVDKLSNYDYKVAPINFNNQVFEETLGRKLRIGFYDHIEGFPLSSPVKRAMEITKTKLRELGHDVVPFILTEEDVQAFEKNHIDSMFIGLYWTCLETY